MKRLSFTEMVERARNVHGDRYTYHSIAEEVKLVSLVVSCSKHGQYIQNYSNHVRGRGCVKCAHEETAVKKLDSLDTIISKANAVHAGKSYKYINVTSSVDNKRFLTAVCPSHGEFVQSVANHLSGTSCPKCSRHIMGVTQRSTLENSASKVRNIHGSAYTVKDFSFTGGRNFVTANCEEHGDFTILSGQFLCGRGCPTCAERNRKWTLDEFKDIASVRHSDKYIYIGLYGPREYRKVLAVCPTHGSFVCGINSHLNYRLTGCAKCADDLHSTSMRLTHEEVIERAPGVHGSTYKLMTTDLVGSKSKTTAMCELHGTFSVVSSDFLRGQGCPDCSKGGKSKLGTEMIDYIKTLAVDAEKETFVGASRYRWDVLVPSKSLAFEFHGLYWHSEEYRSASYHLHKHNLGLSEGVRTIHIFEDEWVNKREVVERLISRLLGPVTDKLYARQLRIEEVTGVDADKFFTSYHIQGPTSGSRYLGLYYNTALVACLGYAARASGRGQRLSEEQAEITRYASSVQVLGGFSKLLAALRIKHTELKSIYTFSDTRMFTGNMYAKVGFTAVATLRPDYFYVKQGRRQRKGTLQKTNIKNNPKLLYDSRLTERELAALNNFYRVYDCGKVKWELQV